MWLFTRGHLYVFLVELTWIEYITTSFLVQTPGDSFFGTSRFTRLDVENPRIPLENHLPFIPLVVPFEDWTSWCLGIPVLEVSLATIAVKPRSCSCSCSCVCSAENLSHYTTPSPEASQETGQPKICSCIFLQEVVKLLKSCRWPIGVRDQHPTPVASGSTSLKLLHLLQKGTLVVHKNGRPHTADFFCLRCGTARERWPVTGRIRSELPVDHVDEPESSC